MAISGTTTSTEETELHAALASLGAARAANPYPTQPGKSFELWLSFRMAAYWQANGAIVELLNGRGDVLPRGDAFVTRGNPGMIRHGHRRCPGSIRVDFEPTNRDALGRPAAQYELQVSLQFHGR